MLPSLGGGGGETHKLTTAAGKTSSVEPLNMAEVASASDPFACLLQSETGSAWLGVLEDA